MATGMRRMLEVFARDRKPCAGKKRGVRVKGLKGSVAVVPTARGGGGARATATVKDGANVSGGPCVGGEGHDVYFAAHHLDLPDDSHPPHASPAGCASD